jgi:hypothetical protein
MPIETFSFRHATSTIPSALVEEVKRAVPGRPSIMSATPCRDSILSNLRNGSGWSDEVKLSPDANITITSCKADVGLCVQTGNMARFYADLMKLSLLHSEERIYAGIFVLPTQTLAVEWGSNIAHFERLCNELPIFSTILHVPLLVIGLKKP